MTDTITAANTWTLEFHGYPPSPNARQHIYAKAKSNKEWRRLAGTVARLQVPPLQRIRLSAVIIRRALGVADADNDMARLKPVVDGLVDAGVIPNDHRGCVVWGTVTEERGPAGLRLVIEALE